MTPLLTRLALTRAAWWFGPTFPRGFGLLLLSVFFVILPFPLPLSVNYGFPGGLLCVPPLSLSDGCLNPASLVFVQSFQALFGQESTHLCHHTQSLVLLSYSVEGLTKLLVCPPFFRGRWV